MRRSLSDVTRQAAAAAALSALALTAMLAAADLAPAADLSPQPAPPPQSCAEPLEHVTFFDKLRRATPPARTPHYYCVTGEMLLPGEIPPPPEYCCRG